MAREYPRKTPRIMRMSHNRVVLGLGTFFACVFLILMGHMADRRALPVGAPLDHTIVIIDPGHGGPDPGALAKDGTLEKDVVLDISLKLAQYLKEAGHCVILTRSDDCDLNRMDEGSPLRTRKQADLKRRVEIINSSGADIAISIHANAIASPRWHGAQVFYHSDRAPENRLLAEYLQTELVHITGETDRHINSSTQQYLLEYVTVPAVTVEVGFLSNPREARLLGDPQYQDRLAWAMMVGISRYFATVRAQGW